MWDAIIPIVAFYLGWAFLLFDTKKYDRPTKWLTYTVIAGIGISAILFLLGPTILPTRTVMVSSYSLAEMGAHNSPQGSAIYVEPVETGDGTLYSYIPKEGGMEGSLSEYADHTTVIYSPGQSPLARRYAVEPLFKWMRLLTQFDDQGRLVLIIPPGSMEYGHSHA